MEEKSSQMLITITSSLHFFSIFKFQAKDFIPKIMIDIKDDYFDDEEIEEKIKSEDGYPDHHPGGDNFDPMDFLEDANVEEQNDANEEIAENNDANHATSSDNLVKIKSEIISDNKNKSEKRKKVSYSAETKVSFCLSTTYLGLLSLFTFYIY